jgi:basic membrane protein A
MKMKKLILMLMVLLCIGAFVFGGGQGEDADREDQGDQPLKVALILSGPANDQGWNAVALQGLTEAEAEFGIETSYSEQVGVAESEAVFTDYASQGYDLVIGHGFQYGDPAVRVAARFPETKFMAIEGAASSENVASYVIACEEAGYLMGVISAAMSETGKIGIVGGVEQPSIIKVVEAYKLGARFYNPDIVVYDVYIGSFTDVNLGKEAALAMADKGADVLSHIANQAGTGVLKAAQERGLLATGDSWDQSVIAPDTVVCSTIYSVPILVKTAVEKVQSGTYEGGIFNLGMDIGVVDVAPYHNFSTLVPAEVQALVKDLKAQIISGELKVPVIEKSTSN